MSLLLQILIRICSSTRVGFQLVMEQCYSITTQHTSKEHRAFSIAEVGKSFHFQLLSF